MSSIITSGDKTVLGASSVVGRAEQTRARYPDLEGFAERNGQRLFYEVYGDGDETIFFLPTWSIVHSRNWKMQTAYFARHFRVLTMDGLGNGKSDRCRDPERYAPAAFADDCVAVMDATGTERALLVGLSRGAQWLLEMASRHPDRVTGAAILGPMFPYTPSHWTLLANPKLAQGFFTRLPAYRGWGRMNANHWRENYPEFVEWFQRRCLSEPHSTKGIEDAVGWGLETCTGRLRSPSRECQANWRGRGDGIAVVASVGDSEVHTCACRSRLADADADASGSQYARVRAGATRRRLTAVGNQGDRVEGDEVRGVGRGRHVLERQCRSHVRLPDAQRRRKVRHG
ncbi:MAG: alpha/beta hydrolase [Solirubrobacteraceae bacterium]